MFCSSALSYKPPAMVPSQALRQRLATGLYQHRCAFSSLCKRSGVNNCIVRAENDTKDESVEIDVDIDKEVTKFARNAATTFAPRASGATKNPAYKGSLLYTVFDVQAWLALFIGGLLSFNIIFPSDQPDIARLMGMWSIWMFTIPSLRARECTNPEKDALNLLFLAIPLANVLLPFVWKNFAFIFCADCALMAGVFAWKGVFIPGSEDEEPSSST